MLLKSFSHKELQTSRQCLDEMGKQLDKGLEALTDHYNMQTNTTHEQLQVIFGELSVLRAESKSGEKLKELEAKMDELHVVVARAMTPKVPSENSSSSGAVEQMYDEVLQLESLVAQDLQGVSLINTVEVGYKQFW